MKTYPHLKCGKRYAVRVQVVPGFHPPNSVEWHEGMTLFTSSVPSWHIGHFYQEAGRLHEFLLTRHLFQTNEYPNGLPEPAGVVSLDHERGPLPEYHRLMFDAAVGERDGKPGLNMTFFGDLSGSRLKPNRKTHCFREAVLGYANRDFRTIDNRHPYPKHGTPGNEEVWLWYFISKQSKWRCIWWGPTYAMLTPARDCSSCGGSPPSSLRSLWAWGESPVAGGGPPEASHHVAAARQQRRRR